MATVPSTQTFTAGEKVTSTKLNAATKTVLDWLLNPPLAMVWGSASTSALPTDGSGVLHNFSLEKFDTDSMVDLTASADKITIQTPGLYELDWSYGVTITAATNTAANTPGHVNTNVFLYQNGAPVGVTSCRPIAAGSVTVAHGRGRLRLAAGDVLQMQTQTRLATGTTAATVVPYNNYNSPSMTARWVAP
jgi:hypothetical protein